MDDFILVVGTGAMACLLAARLALSGQAVCMLGTWEAGLSEIQTNGIRLSGPDGQAQTVRVRASHLPSNFANTRFALVLVKAWQTQRAAEQLAGCLAPDGQALTLQNGFGNREILTDTLGRSRTWVGVATFGATLLSPGNVRAGGSGEMIVEARPELQPWVTAFQDAGFPVRMEPEIDTVLWQKLAVNAAINPLTALFEIPNGALLSSPFARQLIRSIAGEAVQVAARMGIQLNTAEVVKSIEQVAQRTAANRSSMLQDILRGAPTEIEAINGFISKAGITAGVPAPVNQAVYQLIKMKIELGKERVS